MIDDTEQADAIALSRALAATSRKATNAGVTGNPLLDPTLEALARRALAESLGPPRTSDSPFPLTVWRGGAYHTGKPVHLLDGKVVPEGTPGASRRVSPGVTYRGSIGTFVKILEQRANVVAEKRRGWVVEPTTTASGRRTNEDTLEMHAVFLDADGCGDWTGVLEGLVSLDIAHVAYRSGGHQPSTPKWRVAIPLTSPHSVRTDSERSSWRRLYHRIRALVGGLGHLTAEGFDPRTDVPAIPWFLTEKRSASDLPRESFFRPGRSLDLVALALALPPTSADEEDARASRDDGEDEEQVAAEIGPLDDASLESVVAAIAAVTNAVPRGRRDLYLALPGALLDRGVVPGDVVTICEAVSARYPRKHADKHRDNVHNAKTTVAKHAAGDATYTRIGTLQANFPEVAAVVDRFFPNLVDAEVARAVAESVASGPAQGASALSSLPSLSPDGSQPASPKKKKEDVAAVSLKKKLARVAEDASASKSARSASAGKYLAQVLDGSLHLDAIADALARDKVTRDIFEVVGYSLPEASFDEVLRLVIVGERAISPETYRVGAEGHAEGLRRKAKWDAEAPNRRQKANEQGSREHVDCANKIAERKRRLLATANGGGVS